MSIFEIIAILITLAAALSYLNFRVLKLPTTIGLMVLSLLLSLLILVIGSFFPGMQEAARGLLGLIDFNEALMHCMLGFLLFAGALHIDLGDLAQQGKIISLLATIGVLISTLLVGLVTWGMTLLLGLDVALIHCMIFGALISPTDPIAVLGLLKNLGAPRSLATKIAGESLFNDGVGVVVFLAIIGLAGFGSRGHVTAGDVIELLLLEVLGGAGFGLAIGFLAFRMLKSVDSYPVEILISLALVTGGYAGAEALHISAPIAMVVAGILIGNHGRALAMSRTTRQHLDSFWELIDEILNAVLFVLIGLEVLILSFTGRSLLAGLLAIPIVLAARFLAVGLPVTALRRLSRFSPHAVKVLTWSGLRGGISVALALSLHEHFASDALVPTRDLILIMTYLVVVFSIVVQGLTISGQLRRWGLSSTAETEPTDR
jgi:CPA1 family monovalent cation:H+ antiporter